MSKRYEATFTRSLEDLTFESDSVESARAWMRDRLAEATPDHAQIIDTEEHETIFTETNE